MGGVRVKLTDVVKVYDSSGAPVKALGGVSLEVQPGEAVVIMGPSGSGKTTLLNLIGGIDRPTSGTVEVGGVILNPLSERQLAEFRLKYIGFIFQLFNLIPSLRVSENIEIPLIAAGVSGEKRKKRVGELAEKLGIEDKLDRFPEELSGGERQRVAIACALANDPPLIIADEPTGELDSENAKAVTDILVGLAREGRTVIIATHDPLVARMADRIILLRDGKIEGEVLPAELGEGMRAPTSAEEAYLELVENRIRSLDEELRNLAERFARGALGLEEFLERASRLRLLKEALESELLRFGRQPRR